MQKTPINVDLKNINTKTKNNNVLFIVAFILNAMLIFILFQKPTALSWLYEIASGWFVSSIVMSSLWFSIFILVLAIFETKRRACSILKLLVLGFCGINLLIGAACLLVNVIFDLF